MQAQYPIFILAKDDQSIEMIRDEENLTHWYEQPDVEEGLYSGWDIKGYPLKLVWNPEKGIQVIVTEEIPLIADLRTSIFDYVKRSRPDKPFVYTGSQDDLISLFNEVDAHIKSARLRNKIRKFFKLM